MLLAGVVALLQGLTVFMIVSAGRRVRLAPSRALALAFGVLLAQILPLISIEGLAYLAEHLTAAIVTPGGFGPPEDFDPWNDAVITIREFGRFVTSATGGAGFGLGLIIVSLVFLFLSRLPSRLVPTSVRGIAFGSAAVAVLLSFTVSYGFFQQTLYKLVRELAFASSDAWRPLVSTQAFTVSEILNGPPLLNSMPWLRLALPDIGALALVLAFLGFQRVGRLLCLFTRST